MMSDIFSQDNENFVDDGIQIEPFNLNKEREEGYFDADGNFVEYVRDNEIKVRLLFCFCFYEIFSVDFDCFNRLSIYHGFFQDAWLDNVEVDPKYSALSSVATNDEELIEDLSSKDIGLMKRRIANVLEPGETVSLHFIFCLLKHCFELDYIFGQLSGHVKFSVYTKIT